MENWKTGKLKGGLLLVIIALLMAGCYRDPKPRNTLSREKFITVLTDIHIAEAMFQDRHRLKIDSLQSKEIYLSVLKKYNITEEKMLNTTLYYSRHPREYDKIYTEVIGQMGSQIEALRPQPKDSTAQMPLQPKIRRK